MLGNETSSMELLHLPELDRMDIEDSHVRGHKLKQTVPSQCPLIISNHRRWICKQIYAVRVKHRSALCGWILRFSTLQVIDPDSRYFIGGRNCAWASLLSSDLLLSSDK